MKVIADISTRNQQSSILVSLSSIQSLPEGHGDHDDLSLLHRVVEICHVPVAGSVRVVAAGVFIAVSHQNYYSAGTTESRVESL